MSKYAQNMGDNSWSGGAAVRVPTSTRTMLDRLAAKTGRAKGDLLTEAISMLREKVETD